MPMIMAQESEEYPLHRCIFQGDVKTLKILIGTHDIAEKDKQGLPPLQEFNTGRGLIISRSVKSVKNPSRTTNHRNVKLTLK